MPDEQMARMGTYDSDGQETYECGFCIGQELAWCDAVETKVIAEDTR
jgi:hypothetical protein